MILFIFYECLVTLHDNLLEHWLLRAGKVPVTRYPFEVWMSCTSAVPETKK